jgi:hypothetical protein
MYVEVSYDNGRTFSRASGDNVWKIRMETSLLPTGPLPVLVRAKFANGGEAVRRILLYVDPVSPEVETLSPMEGTSHRETLSIHGTARDNLELSNVNITLRPFDKFFYSVPPVLRGMYFDFKVLGATYFDTGIGISLFNENVRFQGQFGMAPPGTVQTDFVSGGRYTGNVLGIKLLANIAYLPFDYFFGPDLAFYSMNFALGANFSYFGMDQLRSPVFMGAVIGQWDIANIDMQFFYPKWKYFRRLALYAQPEFWFASSDVDAGIIFRVGIGIRVNWF